MTDVRSLVEKAISIAGSEAKLGEACGVSQNAIWSAKTNGRVSPKLAKKIHDATNGHVPKWRLCPDVFERDPRPEREEAA